LENGRSTNDEMFREMWEEIENKKTDKARIEKARGTREERKKRSERKRKRKEKSLEH